jgi:riboflavin kinase/FMN adenylyltransferase
MEIITLEKAKGIKFNDLSIALGTFDGLHIGHMALIKAAKTLDGQSAAFTFDKLPIDLFSVDHKPMHLFTLDEKIQAFQHTGLDYLCISGFDRKFAGLDKNDFASLILSAFRPINIVAGYNYTYGKRAEGNVDTLAEFGMANKCNIMIIPPVIYDDEPVSSSRIRECLWAGAVERANALLGYKYNISGVVETGSGLGNRLGFPTANITVAKEKILPLRGVYSVDVAVNGRDYKGVCNIGVKPTVSRGIKETVEIHMISMSSDIYGRKITVAFNKRLRDEMRFGSKEELVDQIKRDIDKI